MLSNGGKIFNGVKSIDPNTVMVHVLSQLLGLKLSSAARETLPRVVIFANSTDKGLYRLTSGMFQVRTRL